MFGPDILVAPVLEAGRRSRTVYLPHGATWTDPYDGAQYPGGTTVTVEADMARIPLFLRDNAALPIL